MRIGAKIRFWSPVVLLLGIGLYSGYSLIRAHFIIDVTRIPQYDFSESVPSLRGGIYCKAPGGAAYPLVKSTPCWEFRLDPVAMTQAVVRAKGCRNPRTVRSQAITIADVLGLPRQKLFAMVENYSSRYQLLGTTDDRRAYDILSDRSLVGGVIVINTDIRRHYEGRRLCHVLGGVNRERSGVDGVESRYNKALSGIPGKISGKKDGRRRVISDKIEEKIPPVPGSDIHLTVDHTIQKIVEEEIKAGVAKFGSGAGWCVVLGAKTGKVLAMASFPDYSPEHYNRATPEERRNRVIGFNYEPGSVMKVITAAAAVDAGFAHAGTVYSTDRAEKDSRGEFKYYRLPNDSHAAGPKLTLKDAIVHSSNIVIGKLGYDFGAERLHSYFEKFGFGRPTGIELPGEEGGIVRNFSKWDKATRSRAPIGQGISVTAIQLASAYQAIANDGIRNGPSIIEKIVDAKGNDVSGGAAARCERVIGVHAAREMRKMMLGVAAAGGTARRAKLDGYSVAGKTGTAQKARRDGRGYEPGLYCATFCGIVPSGVVSPIPGGPVVPPEVVILVTLDFDERRPFHQGGNSAGPVFKRIAERTMRYLGVTPDCPQEDQDDL